MLLMNSCSNSSRKIWSSSMLAWISACYLRIFLRALGSISLSRLNNSALSLFFLSSSVSFSSISLIVSSLGCPSLLFSALSWDFIILFLLASDIIIWALNLDFWLGDGFYSYSWGASSKSSSIVSGITTGCYSFLGEDISVVDLFGRAPGLKSSWGKLILASVSSSSF